MRIVLRTVM